MRTENLEAFLLKARSQTYAVAAGRLDPLLPDSVQYEYQNKEFLYRDIYYTGNGIFSGIEVMYYKGKPVWSMSYFGDFSQMTEERADTLLRKALIDLWDSTRIYKDIQRDYSNFTYSCKGSGIIKKLSGVEEIHVHNKMVYSFVYNGGLIG